jgi:hypothetical protein
MSATYFRKRRLAETQKVPAASELVGRLAGNKGWSRPEVPQRACSELVEAPGDEGARQLSGWVLVVRKRTKLIICIYFLKDNHLISPLVNNDSKTLDR